MSGDLMINSDVTGRIPLNFLQNSNRNPSLHTPSRSTTGVTTPETISTNPIPHRSESGAGASCRNESRITDLAGLRRAPDSRVSCGPSAVAFQG